MSCLLYRKQCSMPTRKWTEQYNAKRESTKDYKYFFYPANIVYGSNVRYPPVNLCVYNPSVAITHWRTNTLNYVHEMTRFMGAVECISPPMCDSHRWIIHTQVYWWISYIRAIHYVCETPFQISGNASDIRNLFMCLGLAVLQKHLTDDYRWMFLRDGFVLCVWRRPGCPPGLTSFLFDTIILNLYVGNNFQLVVV